MKTLFILLLLLSAASIANAQTCVQADLTHPDQTTATWVAGVPATQTGFVLERKLSATGTYAQVGTTAATVYTYTDTTVTRDPSLTNTYYYRVKAVNSAGSSPYSNEACIAFAPRSVAPQAPSGFTLSALSTEEVQASWAGDNTGTITGYSLSMISYTPPNNYGPFVTQPPTTSYVLGGLQKNKTYCGTMTQSIGTSTSAATAQSCATTHLK